MFPNLPIEGGSAEMKTTVFSFEKQDLIESWSNVIQLALMSAEDRL